MNKIKLVILLTALSTISCGTLQSVMTPQPPVSETEPTVIVVPPSQEPQPPERQPEILESTSTTKVYAEVVANYINTYKEIAKEEMRKYGIPASITLAQGILESGAGRGELSVKGNNHFGIKCHKEWTGEVVYHDDDAKGECFRKYQHPNLSYEDHSLFLSQRHYYKSLFSLPKDDYAAWAKGLREAGYATDPKYPEKLIGLIQRYQLHQYDTEVLATASPPPVTSTSGLPPGTPTPSAPIEQPSEKLYVVQKGDTLYSISKKYGITVETLMNLNQLSNTHLSVGQSLWVKPPE